jgi:glycosyltransferase involved in cell wall biosynthesis
VKAASPLLIKYDLRLVCTGKPFDNAEMQFLKSLGILDRTSCLFASEAELKNLYATALLFVYPSLYEGFGIPILEAFAMNCPMAISNTSCFPEVAGDAALYFDPQSIDEMRSVMENAILSPSLRNELVLKGQERLKLYSWRKCAEETAKVYQKVLKKEIL